MLSEYTLWPEVGDGGVVDLSQTQGRLLRLCLSG